MMPIAEHVKTAAVTSQKVRQAGGNEDLQPMLHMVMPDGSITIAALMIEGGGRDIAKAARALILKTQPQHAVLIIEGWTTRKGLPEDDRDFRAVIAGVLRPSQLPPHKRGEQLTVLGESATGEEAYAIYYIERDGTFSETVTSWTLAEDGEVSIATHFRPMFMAEALLRDMGADNRAILIKLAGSEERALELARKTALEYLESGLAGDPAQYTRTFDKLQAEARERIGWRKG